uniref:Endonuclease n=1 Tax=Clytia hemisphaerica TaxID=252671 RepID=A0A7M5XNH5_9CNID
MFWAARALHCSTQRYERHVFRSCSQNNTESTGQYVSRLRQLATTCEFHDTQDEIVDQVIGGCNSKKLRKRLLKEHNLSLDKLLEIALVLETADHQSVKYDTGKPHQHNKPVEEESDDADDGDNVNRISDRRPPRYPKSRISKTPHTTRKITCYRCGSDHLASECRIAKDKTCFNCGKKGHLKTVCQSKQNPNQQDNPTIRYITVEDSSSDDEFVLAIDNPSHSANKRHRIFPIKMNNITVEMLIDSGSDLNIISQETLTKMNFEPKRFPYKGQAKSFNAPIPFKECCYVKIRAGNSETNARFIINPHPSITILGYDSSIELNLLRVGPDPVATTTTTERVNNITANSSKMNDIITEYSDRFQGLGKLKGVSLNIKTDPSIQPVAQKPRRLPILMRKEVDTELDRLLELGVIEPVSDPPSWVNPIVPVPKPNSSNIRLCVDMRAANTAIIREPYQIPTLDELLHEFNGCKLFTKLDLNKGYHQIELDKASRELTAFATHRGIFRYTRLLFGMSSAAEIYQREIELALTGLPGVKNISDDIIIGGRTEEELISRTEAVFERLRTKNLTVNPKKCNFLKTELLYMGHKLSQFGVSPDEEKVRSIVNLLPPTNIKELRSFLGMITYCSKFLPNFATVTEPLRNLLKKKDVPWEWTSVHQSTFDSLKELLLDSETLAYFDVNAETEISTDASCVGLGAVLMQKQKNGTWRPVSYASRSLSPVERRYSPLERECLAVTYALERFRLYLYGLYFTIKTDHKPLVPIFSSPMKSITPRIENLVIKAMPYNFKMVYQPGKFNGADYLSRSNHDKHITVKRNVTEDFVNYVYEHTLPQSVSAETIAHEQHRDPDIKSIIDFITNDKMSPKCQYFTMRHSFSIVNNVVMFNDRIFIPKSLRQHIIQIAHEGHQGIVRTKQRLRVKTWWPGMGPDVEEFIKSCHGCQVVGPLPKPTPLATTKIPDESWLLLGCDLVGPFPTGENLLVCVDYYSKYPEVELLHNVSSKSIATKLRKLFCRYGAPDCIVTDNGPQFRKHTEFRKLLKEFNVKHRKVTPYHPMANGEVERFNRNLKKTIQASIAEGQNWRQALDNFLLSYRTTPHATTHNRQNPSRAYVWTSNSRQNPKQQEIETVRIQQIGLSTGSKQKDSCQTSL